MRTNPFDNFSNAALRTCEGGVASGVWVHGDFVFVRPDIGRIAIIYAPWKLTDELRAIGPEVLVSAVFASDACLAKFGKLVARGKLTDRKFIIDAYAGTRWAQNAWRKPVPPRHISAHVATEAIEHYKQQEQEEALT